MILCLGPECVTPTVLCMKVVVLYSGTAMIILPPKILNEGVQIEVDSESDMQHDQDQQEEKGPAYLHQTNQTNSS